MVALVLVAVPAFGGPYEDGQAAYELNDYKTALEHWRPLAEQGDASAQYKLGFMYRYGEGVPKDYAEARKWYLKAAEQGNAWARLGLAGLYGRGKGVPEDLVLAYMWWNLAAATNDRVPADLGRDSRNLFSELMTSEQIAKAQRMTREWLARHQQ